MILRAFQTRNFESLICVFKAFVRPLLEYAIPIWSPHLIKSKNVLEYVQRKFSGRVFYRCFRHNTSTGYDNRFTLAKLDSLENRYKFDLVFLFKMFCEDIDVEFDEFLRINSKSKRNQHSLQLKSVNCPTNNFGRFNYFYRTHRI